MFIISLLDGSGLAVGFLNLLLGFRLPAEVHFHNESSLDLLLGFRLPAERHFHNESSFWFRSCCLGFEFVSGSGLAACFVAFGFGA